MATAVSRPVSLPPDVPRLPRRSTYDPPQAEVCQRCQQKVYPMEKVGNISGVTFHKLCFRCYVCNQMLTLRTYYTNHTHPTDKEVYCSKHAPLQTTRGLDTQALGIKANLHATSLSGQKAGEIGAGKFGADALFLKHAVQAQQALELARRTNRNMGRHHFNPGYVAGVARAKLLNAQKELERKYRVEENSMLEMVRREQQHEEMRIDAEWREEWEVRLQELTERHERTLNAAGKAKAALQRRNRQQGNGDGAEQDEFEEQKEELKQNMTMRLNAKRQEVAKRYQEREREETARLVRSQSVRMMNDLRTVQDAIKLEMQQELKDKLKSEQRLNTKGQGQGQGVDGEGDAGGEGEEVEAGEVELVIAREVDEVLAELVPHRPPCPPHPPRCRRRDLFHDVSVFARLDEIVGKIAEEEPTTYSDLVFQLTANCSNDLEKARAIYRWITMKDLNHMDIDVSAEDIDSPMGLLHGIKHGTEAYHTLFMRLCGYAGLGCVEVKGHSKSVGYEPGMRIEDESFLNTWNAVQIDSDWWPVQCNWGARHLVLNKDREVQQHKHHHGGSKGKQVKDKIRYQFDEHYFLTDPDEFIKEFWASEPEWQLLEQPITLGQFEATPFVRSVFFHCGLEFDQPLPAVLYTDSKGGVEVRLRVPIDFDNDIVFYYNLATADNTFSEQANQVKLERFVFHFRHDGLAVFTVHVPQRGQYFLEIYANRINESNRLSDDPSASMQPFRLKCACKFKVICDGLAAKMRPLPDCHSGEWGPSKGTRHLALQALSHKSPVIDIVSSEDVTLTLTFRLSRPLQFVARLKANGRNTADFANCTSCSLGLDENENILEVRVMPPDPGQYGLDLYARQEEANRNVEKQAMVHVCKYLINVISDVRSSQASLRES